MFEKWSAKINVCLMKQSDKSGRTGLRPGALPSQLQLPVAGEALFAKNFLPKTCKDGAKSLLSALCRRWPVLDQTPLLHSANSDQKKTDPSIKWQQTFWSVNYFLPIKVKWNLICEGKSSSKIWRCFPGENDKFRWKSTFLHETDGTGFPAHTHTHTHTRIHTHTLARARVGTPCIYSIPLHFSSCPPHQRKGWEDKLEQASLFMTPHFGFWRHLQEADWASEDNCRLTWKQVSGCKTWLD